MMIVLFNAEINIIKKLSRNYQESQLYIRFFRSWIPGGHLPSGKLVKTPVSSSG